MSTTQARSSKHLLIFLFMFTVIAGQVSCKKETKTEPQQTFTALQKEQGDPTGDEMVGLIGPAGGRLQSPDQVVSLEIPAGAVETETRFSIQEVTAVIAGPSVKSYRLLPSGLVFKKPLTVTFKYETPVPAGGQGGFSLAYQDEDGFFFVPANMVQDTVAKTLTTETVHFSDWMVFEQFFLEPARSYLVPGEQTTIRVMWYNLLGDLKDGHEDMQLGVPEAFGGESSHGISWAKLSGGGTVTSDQPVATYTAPAAVTGEGSAILAATIRDLKIIGRKAPAKIIMLTSITLQSRQFLNYEFFAEQIHNNGECVNGCISLDADAFSLRGYHSGNRYVQLEIDQVNGVGTYPMNAFTRIEVCRGWDLGNKVYKSVYYPCDGCDARYPQGKIDITRFDGPGGYIEGSFETHLFENGFNDIAKPVKGTFRVYRDQ